MDKLLEHLKNFDPDYSTLDVIEDAVAEIERLRDVEEMLEGSEANLKDAYKELGILRTALAEAYAEIDALKGNQ